MAEGWGLGKRAESGRYGVYMVERQFVSRTLKALNVDFFRIYKDVVDPVLVTRTKLWNLTVDSHSVTSETRGFHLQFRLDDQL